MQTEKSLGLDLLLRYTLTGHLNILPCFFFKLLLRGNRRNTYLFRYQHPIGECQCDISLAPRWSWDHHYPRDYKIYYQSNFPIGVLVKNKGFLSFFSRTVEFMTASKMTSTQKIHVNVRGLNTLKLVRLSRSEPPNVTLSVWTQLLEGGCL